MRSVAVEARDGRVRVGREGAIDESARVGVRFIRRRLGRDDGGRVGTAFLFFELRRWYRRQSAIPRAVGTVLAPSDDPNRD